MLKDKEVRIFSKLLEANQIKEAAALLKNGDVVAIPTETVYGLAADATNDQALRKIFAAKNRPLDHPLIVHIESFSKVDDWADFVPKSAKKLAEHFWPGPLTMIFQKRKTVSDLITAGLNTVALRVPNHPVALEVIRELGRGVAAPSANAHKKTSPTKPEHVLKTLEGKIAAILDGGACRVGIESTIVDITKEVPVILRPGAITASMIEKALNMKVYQPFNYDRKVSGNMASHYQPEKPLLILSKKEVALSIKKEKNIAVIHHSIIAGSQGVEMYQMPNTKTKYAQKLYETLHHIDGTNVEKILVETPPNSDDWADIRDRLKKASSKS
ncbi:MAG: threonylcarbamoyl-AMP synthase [Proteobacteria bacterium]|nr:threonylcarbamoyl-AMP synthase [Pseudomonadota bacterium]